jgi:hypothetical protein
MPMFSRLGASAHCIVCIRRYVQHLEKGHFLDYLCHIYKLNMVWLGLSERSRRGQDGDLRYSTDARGYSIAIKV